MHADENLDSAATLQHKSYSILRGLSKPKLQLENLHGVSSEA